MKARFFWPALAVGLLLLVIATRAAQLVINLGTTANDNTGDTLRVSFQKVNSNFTELYTSTFTNGSMNAGSGLVKSSNTFYFARSTTYPPGQIPYAADTIGISFANLYYDAASGHFTIGAPLVAGPSMLTVGGSSSIDDGIYIGSGSRGDGNNMQIWQSSTDSYLSFGKSTGSYFFHLYDTFLQLDYLRARSGILEFPGSQVRPVNVGASKIIRTDSSTNMAALTVGSGLSFDGTTLSAAGASIGVNGTNLTSANLLDSSSVTWSVDGSNITATAVGSTESAPINNFYTTNNFFVSGKGNTLVITQQLMLQYVKTNLLATDGNGLVTNAVYGSGIAWDPTTRTISSTASGGDTTGTNIVTLTQSGTNLSSALDFSLIQNGGVFKIVLTNNLFIGTPSGVANTAFRHGWLAAQQPSTGTCLITWTNGTFGAPEGQALVNDTNNGSVVWYQMNANPFTNGLVDLWMSTRMKLIP